MDDRAADYHLGPLERSRPHRRTGCCLRRYSTDAHDPIRRAAPTRRPPILAGPQRFPVVAIRWVSLVAGFRSRGRRSSGTVAWRIVFFFFTFQHPSCAVMAGPVTFFFSSGLGPVLPSCVEERTAVRSSERFAGRRPIRVSDTFAGRDACARGSSVPTRLCDVPRVVAE